jgi:hypothetical protein
MPDERHGLYLVVNLQQDIGVEPMLVACKKRATLLAAAHNNTWNLLALDCYLFRCMLRCSIFGVGTSTPRNPLPARYAQYPLPPFPADPSRGRDRDIRGNSPRAYYSRYTMVVSARYYRYFRGFAF